MLPLANSRAAPSQRPGGQSEPWELEEEGLQGVFRPKEEEGLQGVFKRLRRNGHQLEKGLQMAPA
jgi:hypothetical protein